MEEPTSDVLGDPSSTARWIAPTASVASTWAARFAWAGLALTGTGFGSALSGASRSAQVTMTLLLWAGWAVVLLALLVPSTVSLTAVRLAAPVAPAAASLALLDGGGVAPCVAALALGLLTTAIVLTGEVGAAFVQASAYGSERRFLLRPPAAMVPVLVVAWVVMTAIAVTGALLATDGSPIVGGLLSAAAVVIVVGLAPRFHRLSNRWLVMVPAGLVLHDSVALAETFMVKRNQVASLSLALADTEAADVTAGALGHAIEIELTDFETVVLAVDGDNPGGRALHARSLLVSPTRPGRTIAAWANAGS